MLHTDQEVWVIFIVVELFQATVQIYLNTMAFVTYIAQCGLPASKGSAPIITITSQTQVCWRMHGS